jgi:tetratricopeptide (TPR) repeat protein
MAKKNKPKRSKDSQSPVIPLPPRAGAETMMADLSRKMQEQNFINLDDAQRFMDRLLEEGGGRIPLSPPLSPSALAQDLAYQAWDAPTDRKAAALAREALALSPDCTDAYNVLAETVAASPEEACDYYQQGVDAGIRHFGEKFFAANKGHFWDMIETRPYMRARQGLADCLWATGREEESIAHSEAMLDLNPNDNQGIRDVLLSRYLVLGNDAGAERLFRQYKNDWSAPFLWSRVLLDLRRGDHVAAKAALLAAMEYNSHVASFLTGKKKLPAQLPETYSPGTRDEAVLYMASFAESWLVSSNALEWLISQLAN